MQSNCWLVSILFSCVAASAQVVPFVAFVASYRETVTVLDEKGAVLSSKVNIGAKLRSSKGDELFLRDRGVLSSGTLALVSEGKLFNLDFGSKRAVFARRFSPRPIRSTRRYPDAVGSDVIAGLPCLIVSMRASSGQPQGRVWISVENEIELKLETTHPAGKGSTTITVNSQTFGWLSRRRISCGFRPILPS